jgi:hypothetical protein
MTPYRESRHSKVSANVGGSWCAELMGGSQSSNKCGECSGKDSGFAQQASLPCFGARRNRDSNGLNTARSLVAEKLCCYVQYLFNPPSHFGNPAVRFAWAQPSSAMSTLDKARPCLSCSIPEATLTHLMRGTTFLKWTNMWRYRSSGPSACSSTRKMARRI